MSHAIPVGGHRPAGRHRPAGPASRRPASERAEIGAPGSAGGPAR